MLDWINGRYASRRGFINTKWYQLQYRMGRYQQYKVPLSSIERLVFVCTGNICRSAFAEAVAKSMGMKAISVGVHAIEGAVAAEQTIYTAQMMGYDLSNHRSTPVMYPTYSKSDLLIAMEPWQGELVRQNLALEYNTTLLGLWGIPKQPYIHDPYMSSGSYFIHCFKYIEKSVHALIDRIQKAN